MTDDEKATICAALADRLRPILAGHPPEIQGGALAWAFAIWVAGHRHPNPRKQRRNRAVLVSTHFNMATGMVPAADAEIDAWLTS